MSPSARQTENTGSPLRSVHTSNLPELFDRLQISVVVSTYQAGKVVLIRSDGQTLNTHFRNFGKPMGVAVDHSRIVIGGANTIWEYRNMPAVASKLEPLGKHDACYIPRRIHVTGDIDIHELGWDNDDQLWIINTRFCCLCTIDADHSFHPRWRPPFISALAPEDRCHLNGLAMVNGRVKYVTALGETNAEGAWRANKASGGILIDVESGETLLRGLSMPHSPRWYRDQLWVLESGQGSLARVDLDNGSWETVARLPGFTRGVDFVGPLAFIGLSQVRESAVFSGIPVVQRTDERVCGIWVVNIETGETVGFLRFEAGVQEIFAVQVLQGIRFPEMMEWDDPRMAGSYVLPDEALAHVHVPSEADLAGSPSFHFQRGNHFYQRAELASAIAAYRNCVALQAEFPNARYNLAIALGDAGQYVEAEDLLRQVVDRERERADVHNSLGYLAMRQCNPEDAIQHFESAISVKPNYVEAHRNLAMALLQTGEYERGFVEYDWRWTGSREAQSFQPHLCWDGRPVPEKTLLIYAEQGAGDAIQFARFLPRAAARCRRLIVACQRNLVPVIATIDGVAEVREPGSIRVAEFDVYLPMISLPRVFEVGFRTIPCEIPYVNLATLHRRKGVFALVPSAGNFPKVGVVWAGNPEFALDRYRSCSLRDFLPVLRVPGIAFYSLQKSMAAADEIASLPADVVVQDLAPKLNDFGDLALAIAELDLVISVDTAAAHLAGALGRPVWTLLPYAPDWRWHLHMDVSPWYPSMKLFRQSREGAWEDVMAKVAAALQFTQQE